MKLELITVTWGMASFLETCHQSWRGFIETQRREIKMGMSLDHMNTIISITPLIEMGGYPEVEEHSSDQLEDAEG